jgi:hypothetical protein
MATPLERWHRVYVASGSAFFSGRQADARNTAQDFKVTESITINGYLGEVGVHYYGFWSFASRILHIENSVHILSDL